MYKISDVISKPVYTIYEGVQAGTIINFLYDKRNKKIKGFFIFDDDSDIEQFITVRNVYKLGNDNLLIKNRDKIQISKIDKKSILGINMVSIKGENAGEIKDVFFDEKYNVYSIETKNGVVIPVDDIINIGQDIILFDTNEKKVKVSRMKSYSKILVEDLPHIKVSILQDSELTDVPIISNNFEEKDFSIESRIMGETTSSFPPKKSLKSLTLPPKILSNPKSIIGKYAKEMVCGLNGEVIIKKGQMVTEKIFEKAQKHSKVFELTNNVSN